MQSTNYKCNLLIDFQDGIGIKYKRTQDFGSGVGGFKGNPNLKLLVAKNKVKFEEN